MNASPPCAITGHGRNTKGASAEKGSGRRVMLMRAIVFIALFGVALSIASCRNKTEQAPTLSKHSEQDALVFANSNIAIPRAEILHADNSLIGLKALSVVVTVEGSTKNFRNPRFNRTLDY
jgi:hypothetical protein